MLVVIGILIALQINNWNESNKDRELVKTSLTSLKVNLNEDIKDLNKQISYNKSLLDNIDFTLKLIISPKFENKPLSVFADSIGDLTNERLFLPNITTFKSMESGSIFPLIADQKFKESIYKYYVHLEKLSKITNENNLFVKKHVEDFVYNEMELGTFFPKSNPHSMNRDLQLDNTNLFRNNPAFENVLIGRKFRAGGEIYTSENAIVVANELIELIDYYLELND
ncbi:hypothetical protein GCM10007940_07660 [Portibacter lacus]|uniref:Uncharacterized protein n=2 Tax=Portibacter lacus TaxID=1099794 RepID=A0AA37WC59_9BACT|nr:hypothetical protein GCM10007940_07660 [Portibacter lacus]